MRTYVRVRVTGARLLNINSTYQEKGRKGGGVKGGVEMAKR